MNAHPVKTAIGVTLVVAATVVLHTAGILRPIEGFARSGVNALSGWVYQRAATVGVRGDASASAASCPSREAEAVSLTLLKEENESLRRQLRFLERRPMRTVGADVIGRDVEPIGNTLLINRGAREGIAKGQAVIVEDGVLIGKIARAEEDMAVVQLLSDGQSKIASTIMNRDRSIGITEGGYGLSVRMGFIPQHEAISPGDVVITSGLEKGIPRGLVIGTIEAVEREAYQPFQRAVLTTTAKLDRIAFVSVLLVDSDETL